MPVSESTLLMTGGGSAASRLLKKRVPECIALVAYMALLALVMSRHEPWFDEAEAWLMARDLSLADLLFGWLRYEGHLPVWYLLLALPAKLGVPYEWGLKAVEWLCAAAAAAVLLLRSPFPRVVRLALPFTYFLFYQYGVISRCYSVMMLFLWLAAAAHERRNEKPVRYMLALAGLGGTMAYGILVAFGMAVAWFMEMAGEWRRNRGEGMIRQALRDGRFRALLALAAVNVLFVVLLYPAPDQYNPLSAANSRLTDTLNTVLTAPAEAVFIDLPSMPFMGEDALLWPEMLCSAAVMALFFAAMAARRRTLTALLVLLPMFAFFAFTYFTIHHSGVLTMAFLFLLWVARPLKENEKPPRILRWFERHRRRLMPLLVAAGTAVFAVQTYWSAESSLNDWRGKYSAGSSIACFIQEHRLEQNRLFLSYQTHLFGSEACLVCNVDVLPYFNRNIFFNLNGGDPGMAFAQHRLFDYQTQINAVRGGPVPDFIICPGKDIVKYAGLLPIGRFTRVAAFDYCYYWKASFVGKSDFCVYMRDDLAPSFPSLTPLEDPLLEQYKPPAEAE